MKYLLSTILIIAVMTSCNNKATLSKEAQALGCTISAPSGWNLSDTLMMGVRIIIMKSPLENDKDDFQENMTVMKGAPDSREQDYADSLSMHYKESLMTMHKSLLQKKPLTEENLAPFNALI